MYKTSTCYSFLSLLFSALTGSTDATCSRFSQNWSVSQDTQWDPHWSMHTCPILPSLALIFIRLSLCTRYKWHSFHSPVLTVSVRTGHSCGHTCTIDLATCTTWLSNYLILSFPYGMDGRVLWTCTHVPLHLVVLSFPHYMTWQSYRHSTHVYLHDLSFPFFTHGIRDGTVVWHYHRNRGGKVGSSPSTFVQLTSHTCKQRSVMSTKEQSSLHLWLSFKAPAQL